jgi:hypothetical protein
MHGTSQMFMTALLAGTSDHEHSGGLEKRYFCTDIGRSARRLDAEITRESTKPQMGGQSWQV